MIPESRSLDGRGWLPLVFVGPFTWIRQTALSLPDDPCGGTVVPNAIQIQSEGEGVVHTVC